RVDGRAGRARVVADEDPLARGEAVRLDDLRPGRAALEVGLRRARAVEAAVGGAGDLVALEDLLREDLRSFDARSRRPRPEREDAGAAQLVREAEDERLLRADHDEPDRFALGERDTPGDVVVRDRDVPRVLRGAGIAGSAEDLGREGRRRELPHERVLAAT